MQVPEVNSYNKSLHRTRTAFLKFAIRYAHYFANLFHSVRSAEWGVMNSMIITKCSNCKKEACTKVRKLFPFFVIHTCKSCGAELSPSLSVEWWVWLVSLVALTILKLFVLNGEYVFLGLVFMTFAYLLWQSRMLFKLRNIGDNNVKNS